MNHRKIESPENFVYAEAQAGSWKVSGQDIELSLEDFGGDLFRFRVFSPRWPRGSGSQAGLSGERVLARAGAVPSRARCLLGEGGAPLIELEGIELLSPLPGRGFGLCGPKWILAFAYDSGRRCHGMGEKNFGPEVSGRRTRFWNSDLFADFEWSAVSEARADPLYASLPVLYLSKGGVWAALVLDNPAAPFMNTGAGEGIFSAGSTPFERSLSLGARGGAPDLWILAGPDPAELVRRVQLLQGATPLPPLWALGHHQCRWGYRNLAEVEAVAAEYDRRKIPDDGLWLDIDSMDGFRVFTTDPVNWADHEVRIAALAARGFRVVPILDPGLRRDPGFPVYERARKAGILCVTPEGRDYTGFAWPGHTVFPDFSLPEGRAFWSREVAAHARQGFAGYWIDMNDPSTGSAPLDDMLFAKGRAPHEEYHNQYALGMAAATRAGLEAARPGERPFVISRSAWLGQARHSALWTGDNVSNKAHLAAAIPLSLNLSISGLPFNGPDLPGFAGEADAALMRAWYKACFLFPFLRNHRIAGTRDQEPWTRGSRTEGVVAGLLRSRYRLLPYLYNLFIDQEERGDPILRPLWWLDSGDEAARVADQFLVGPSILQSPILEPRERRRELLLPPGLWYDMARGRSFEGGRRIQASSGFATTPLHLALSSIIPLLARPTLKASQAALDRIELLVCPSEGRMTEFRYRFDDGATTAYREGRRSEVAFKASLEGGMLRIESRVLASGAGSLSWRILVPTDLGVRSIEIDGREEPAKRERLELANSRISLLATGRRED